jgi:xylose isomerase
MGFIAQLGVSQWVQLPFEVRQKLVKMFDLIRTGGSEVIDGRLKTDGYTEKDLRGVSLEKMKSITGAEGGYYELFDKVLTMIEENRIVTAKEAETKLEERNAAQQAEIQNKVLEAVTQVVELADTVKRRGRPPKAK